MNFLYAILCTIVMLAWSYVQLKTYQLVGYNIPKFLDNTIKLNFAFGSKNALKFTKRMVRFVCLYILASFGLYLLIFFFASHPLLVVLDGVIVMIFSPILITIIHYILYPVEKLIKQIYLKKAFKKLSLSKAIKVGITGSFGKTSTKNILSHILGKQFKVCASPASYNTEMGICKTILEKLDDEDVFIAEMGARNKGDIEKLAKLVQPTYAILTTIGQAHLETFKSIENIENTKFELVEFMSPDGSVVINGNSPSNIKLYKKCKKAKFLTCKNESYAYAQEVETSSSGSSFTLVIDGQRRKCKTVLLGRVNIDNIVTASALAYLMGVSFDDIQAAISTLEPTAHRLELLKSGSVTIIDDAYNSNPTGAQEALKVLESFEGRKIVITPGLVEMGEEQSRLNFQFGAQIADVADYVIIMNETNKNNILSGLISHNFDKKKIFFASSRAEQEEKLKLLTCEGCVVLFENDLPDNFS